MSEPNYYAARKLERQLREFVRKESSDFCERKTDKMEYYKKNSFCDEYEVSDDGLTEQDEWSLSVSLEAMRVHHSSAAEYVYNIDVILERELKSEDVVRLGHLATELVEVYGLYGMDENCDDDDEFDSSEFDLAEALDDEEIFCTQYRQATYRISSDNPGNIMTREEFWYEVNGDTYAYCSTGNWDMTGRPIEIPQDSFAERFDTVDDLLQSIAFYEVVQTDHEERNEHGDLFSFKDKVASLRTIFRNIQTGRSGTE